MRTLGTRRAVLVAGAAAVAAAVLAGCSAGQVAETSLKRPSNQGVNQDNSDGSVSVRNLAVVYNGIQGYAAGANAPLQVGLYNQTTQPITVDVTSSRPTDGTNAAEVGTASSVVLIGTPASGQPGFPSGTPGNPAGSVPAGSGYPVAPTGQAPAPSGGPVTPSVTPGAPSPSASPGASVPTLPGGQMNAPAKITLPADGAASFLPGDPQTLELQGLSKALRPGEEVYVTFSFSNGAKPLTLAVAVATPESPVSRAPGNPDENKESE